MRQNKLFSFIKQRFQNHPILSPSPILWKKSRLFPFAALAIGCILLTSFNPAPTLYLTTSQESIDAGLSQSDGDNADSPADEPVQTQDSTYYDLFASSWQVPDETAGASNFWIEVNLSDQMLYAYRGGQIINAFLVSTGAGSTPTVTGTYKIYAKYDTYNMTGPGYDYPDVPYTMFFYKGYSIHGTYWHTFFGTPMSWGCVNMKTEEATWIYENAPVGTYVFIHY